MKTNNKKKKKKKKNEKETENAGFELLTPDVQFVIQ